MLSSQLEFDENADIYTASSSAPASASARATLPRSTRMQSGEMSRKESEARIQWALNLSMQDQAAEAASSDEDEEEEFSSAYGAAGREQTNAASEAELAAQNVRFFV